MDSQNPLTVLTEEETKALIRSGVWPEGADNHMGKWRMKSPWLNSRLNEYEKEGYVYNAEAMRKIEAELGIPKQPDNGSVLSILVYNAQTYRREDKLAADGFVRLLPALVEQAITENRKVEVRTDSVFGVGLYLCRPIKTENEYFVLLPRARSKGFRADGQRYARLATA